MSDLSDLMVQIGLLLQAKIASCQAKAKPLYLKQVEGLFFRYPVKPTIMSDLSDLMVQIGLLLQNRSIPCPFQTEDQTVRKTRGW